MTDKGIITLERTLVLVKPEAIDFRYDFLERVDAVAERIFDRKLERVPAQVWREHYLQFNGKPYFEPMVRDFDGRPVHVAVYGGAEGTIQRIRDVQGKTRPWEAVAGTIRGDFRDALVARGVVLKEDLGNGYFLVRNFIHASDSPESFIREAGVWGNFLGIDLINVGRN